MLFISSYLLSSCNGINTIVVVKVVIKAPKFVLPYSSIILTRLRIWFIIIFLPNSLTLIIQWDLVKVSVHLSCICSLNFVSHIRLGILVVFGLNCIFGVIDMQGLLVILLNKHTYHLCHRSLQIRIWWVSYSWLIFKSVLCLCTNSFNSHMLFFLTELYFPCKPIAHKICYLV